MTSETTRMLGEALYELSVTQAERDEAQARLDQRDEDAARYRRLRVLGCAPAGSGQLADGTVLRFQVLDAFVDADIKAYPSRGEATHDQ